MVGRPLNHPDQRLAAFTLTRDIVEQIAMAKAAAVRCSFGVKLVERCADFLELGRIEKTPHDRIAVAPILREIGRYTCRLIASQTLRTTHGMSPPPQGEHTSTR